jgi:nucleoid-associated protein YgaU
MQAGKQEAATTTNEETSKTKNTAPITSTEYTVVAGDTLWKIAERKYGSGYNWVDLVKVNKLANANKIEKGQKLILPEVQKRAVTGGMIAKAKTGKVTITGDSYKVQKGDHLWKIAQGAYGDGYEWSKIAKANNIKNPGLIYAGQILKLPR